MNTAAAIALAAGGPPSVAPPLEDSAATVEFLETLITRVLLEHFGDGRTVHADVVMDTVQYRLAREYYRDGGCQRHYSADAYYHCGRGRRGSYNVWADDRAAEAYCRCLDRLVRSGRMHVVHDVDNDDGDGCSCAYCRAADSAGGVPVEQQRQ